MKLTRRKAIAGIGIGGLALGGVFGSGAFTQTEVDREFNLAIAPDEDSLLSLEPTGDIEAVEEEDGVLAFNFDDFEDAEGIPSQGDTAFEGAFTITNNTQEEIAVWMPSADAEEGNVTTQLYDSGNRSTEVVVDGDEADDVETNAEPDNGTRPDSGEKADLTFPPTLHKSWKEEDVDDPSGSGAAEQSRAFGMTPGGAVSLESGASVTGDVNFLVIGSREEVQEFPDGLFLRFKAERRDDLPDDEDEWATHFQNTSL